MKIKIDENLPNSLSHSLAQLGHSVHTVHDERLSGKPDHIIWDAAQAEGRFVITQDLGFADIRKLKKHHGIMLLRTLESDEPLLENLVLSAFHQLGPELPSALIIVTESKIRVRQ